MRQPPCYIVRLDGSLGYISIPGLIVISFLRHHRIIRNCAVLP